MWWNVPSPIYPADNYDKYQLNFCFEKKFAEIFLHNVFNITSVFLSNVTSKAEAFASDEVSLF